MLDHSFEYYLVRCMEIPEILHFFSLKQLISCPTRISCSSPTIIDHILASQPENVSQKRSLALKFRIVSLYFVLGKLLKLRQDHIKKSISAHWRITLFLKPWKRGNFLIMKTFFKINEAYSNFIQKLTSVIDEIAPCKAKGW